MIWGGKERTFYSLERVRGLVGISLRRRVERRHVYGGFWYYCLAHTGVCHSVVLLWCFAVVLLCPPAFYTLHINLARLCVYTIVARSTRSATRTAGSFPPRGISCMPWLSSVKPRAYPLPDHIPVNQGYLDCFLGANPAFISEDTYCDAACSANFCCFSCSLDDRPRFFPPASQLASQRDSRPY